MTGLVRVAAALGFVYATLGAVLCVYAADVHGRPGMLRVGAVHVLLAGVAAFVVYRARVTVDG